MLKFKRFPFIQQHDTMDCGPACLSIVSKYYGKDYSIKELRELCFLTKDGASLLGIEEGAKEIGFETIGVRISLEDLIVKAPLPCILYWNESHYVVLYKVKTNSITGKRTFKVSDPSHGRISFNEEEFVQSWIREGKGLTLFLQPDEEFFKKEPENNKNKSLGFLLKFLTPYKREMAVLLSALGISSVFTLVFPFLTMALIDEGVSTKNLDYVFIILLAQVFLFLGSTIIEIIKNWVLVFVNSKINITIISDFLNKMIRLPFKFFDAKQTGDFVVRIQDHNRIEEFLTSQSLVVIFSSLNFIVFFLVLTYYDLKILLVYVVLTTLAIIWSLIFFKKIEKLDYSRFRYRGENQQTILELVGGIIEVKLNGIEKYKITEWQKKTIQLFDINLKSLRVNQMQLVGYDFINQLKNIVVIFIASREVVLGNITLGGLLSVSYIIGQMNSPVNQLITFLKSWQLAKLSMTRLHELQNQDDEEKETDIQLIPKSELNDVLPHVDITLNNLSFQYSGSRSPYVLKDVNAVIPHGKTTAIVGESGSGKTTLMKLLLKFYAPAAGSIVYGENDLQSLSANNLRANCGVVLQDGFIFSDSIERNIATGDGEIDYERLDQAMKIANIQEFVNSLPGKLKTTIGSSGNGISGGQKQRLLIARAVYKNPHFIFFDEATSALDAENEKVIYGNLLEFFKGKTVLKIAHRLSTVRDAHQIIVLKEGSIVECGTHDELISHKSTYFNLVRNQLELSV